MSLLLTLFAVSLCFAAVMVLGSKNPVHSVLFLVLVFCNGAGILLLFGFEFLAMVFLVVYVGAIAVLFLFIVMMLNLKLLGFRQSLLNHYPVSFFILLLFGMEFAYYLGGFSFDLALPVALSSPYFFWSSRFGGGSGSIFLVGNLLYTYYSLPFLLAGFVLLVAMIVSIFLALGDQPSSLKQDIHLQVVRSNVVLLSRGSRPGPGERLNEDFTQV